MSTMLAPPSAVERRDAREPSPAPHADRARSDSFPPPLRSQIEACLHGAGLTKTDIRIFITCYVALVLFSTSLCLVARVGHEQAWAWGVRLMNAPLALAGAGLLGLAVLAAAAALAFARRSNCALTRTALAVATLACLGFVASLAIDVDAKWARGIRPGDRFRPNERYVARAFGVKLPRRLPNEAGELPAVPDKPPARSIDPLNGRRLFLGTCMSCHGPRGEGLPGQGKSLIANEFVRSLDDAKLFDFLKVGRQPWDPLNTTKVQMPPRGGNPMLSDDDLRDVVAFVRTLQAPPADAAAGEGDATRSQAAANGSGSAAPGAALASEAIDPSLLVARWVVSSPPPGPQGLAAEYLAELARQTWKPPRDAVAFVNGYYLAAQFGGLHAGAVAIVFAALFVHAIRGRITAARRAPLALAAGGCAVMTAAWWIVFPFVFLI